MAKTIPFPPPETGLRALRAMLRERHPLAAMQVFHAEMGDVFRVQLPGFTPERVIYSIYLTQRHPDYWEQPETFLPERHAPGQRAAAYTWLAFGGGPRNCIGAAYGQVEAKVVLATLLQRFELELRERKVHAHMGATLEPRPGVRMRVQTRR